MILIIDATRQLKLEKLCIFLIYNCPCPHSVCSCRLFFIYFYAIVIVSNQRTYFFTNFQSENGYGENTEYCSINKALTFWEKKLILQNEPTSKIKIRIESTSRDNYKYKCRDFNKYRNFIVNSYKILSENLINY